MTKPITDAGLSWSGHKIQGDVESIRAVVDLMHGDERAASLGIEIANYAKKIVFMKEENFFLKEENSFLKEENEKLEAIIAELRDSRAKLFVKFEKLENATKKPSNVLPIQTSVSEQTKIIANLRATVTDLSMERDHLMHLVKQNEPIVIQHVNIATDKTAK